MNMMVNHHLDGLCMELPIFETLSWGFGMFRADRFASNAMKSAQTPDGIHYPRRLVGGTDLSMTSVIFFIK